ncbi:polysaccharide pyruvyl transferase family protein [Bacillus tianshenii]|uniref:polysaccharide pyruvyl transferase family protein n=1 Tax=Sutcliffiella tianshenii TaxID=1463404 RepID=UPI001CD51E2F|nr:polysaccharide pyruvyl transferase family protein [Bacillus tianshenii]MCA1320831.1 polysaccharide pyruvyl transferase family protein [Bacillus tianshenii]
MKLLYIGYLGFNNIGDEVCYESFVQSVNRWSTTVEKIIPYDIKKNAGIRHLLSTESIDAVILGGGSLFQGDIFLSLAEEAISLGLPIYSYGTGIDYLTENTIDQYRNGEAFEPQTFFNDRRIDTKRIKNVVDALTYTGVRGPLTLQFLKGLTAHSDSIEIIGDSGLVYTPEIDNYISDNYLMDLKTPIVAVNWGTTFNKLFGSNEESLENQLAESCMYLISKGYHIVIYPMWDKDIESCQKLYGLINNNKHVTLIPEVCNSSQVYSFLSKCHFSINIKLHANILSAAATTPFIQLAYRSKGFDFALSINQYDNTIYTHSKELLKTVMEKEKNFTQYRRKYTKALKKEKETYIKKHKWMIENFFNGNEKSEKMLSLKGLRHIINKFL